METFFLSFSLKLAKGKHPISIRKQFDVWSHHELIQGNIPFVLHIWWTEGMIQLLGDAFFDEDTISLSSCITRFATNGFALWTLGSPATDIGQVSAYTCKLYKLPLGTFKRHSSLCAIQRKYKKSYNISFSETISKKGFLSQKPSHGTVPVGS